MHQRLGRILKLLGLIGIIGSLAIAGCKSVETTGEVKHDFGQTSNDIGPLDDCHAESSTVQDPRGKIYQDYLWKIANKIMINNPAAFKNDFAPKVFCLVVDPTRTGQLDARSSSSDGRVLFNLTAFDAAPHEAFLASILAHELAHVLMNHGGPATHPAVLKDPRGKIIYQNFVAASKALDAYASLHGDEELKLASDIYDFLRKNNLFGVSLGLRDQADAVANLNQAGTIKNIFYRRNALKAGYNFFAALDKVKSGVQVTGDAKTSWDKYAAQVATLLPATKAVTDAKTTTTAQLDAILRQLVKDPSEQANWKEQQADEIGYELYLRTAYKKEFFTAPFEYFMTQRGEQGVTLDQCEKSFASGAVPPRGKTDHPTDCFRYWDITVKEEKEHAANYRQLFITATHDAFFPADFARIKQMSKS